MPIRHILIKTVKTNFGATIPMEHVGVFLDKFSALCQYTTPIWEGSYPQLAYFLREKGGIDIPFGLFKLVKIIGRIN